MRSYDQMSWVLALSIGVSVTPTEAKALSPEPAEEQVQQESDVPKKFERGKIGVLGIAGVVLAGASIAPLSTGVARSQREPIVTPMGEIMRTTYFQTPATDAALVLGAIGVGVGAVMLIVDLAVCGRRPQGCRRGPRVQQAGGSGWALRF